MPSNSTERRVVVTGLGIVCARGNDVDDFWNQLVAGKCGVDTIRSFDATPFATRVAAEVKDFDPAPAFPSAKEIRRTDRYSQFGVYAAWRAVRDSGLDLNRINLDDAGVFIGSGIGGTAPTTKQHQLPIRPRAGPPAPLLNPPLNSETSSRLGSIY